MIASEFLSRGAILKILQELIRTPSVNASLSPDEAHGKEAIGKVAQNWLSTNGMKRNPITLFTSKGNLWLDSGSTAGGNIASQETSTTENCDRSCEGKGVIWLYFG